MIGIYKITSPSGRVYIGQSWDIEERFKSYRKMSNKNKGQKALFNSFLKYKSINHIFQIIHELPQDISQEILNNYEILYINQYKELGFNMLNIREGGSRGKHSEETKKLISKTLEGYKHSEEAKLRMSESRIGQKRKYNPKIVGENNSFFGKKHSSESKEKISKSKEIPILQLTKEGVLIKEWSSAQSAAMSLNFRQSGISACCNNYRGQKYHKGYMWKFK